MVRKKRKTIKKELVAAEKEIVKEVRVIEHEVELAEKLLKKFGTLEILHVFLGALLFIGVFAFVGPIWIFAITASWPTVVLMNVLVVAILISAFYISGFRVSKKHHVRIVHGSGKRAVSIYLTCLLVAMLFVLVIRPAEFFVLPLALKQVFALLLPALIGGLIADLLLS